MQSQANALQDMELFMTHRPTVEEKLRRGADPVELAASLCRTGMSADGAKAMIDKLADSPAANALPSQRVEAARPAHARRAVECVRDDASSNGGIAGALLAAVIGGVAWALVAKASGYEFGFVAWGIGVMVGFATVLMSGGRPSTSMPFVAVGASAFGILLGKYLTFVALWNDYVGTVGAEDVDLAAMPVIEVTVANGLPLFIEFADLMFDFFDVVWIAFAVSSAYKIVSASVHSD